MQLQLSSVAIALSVLNACHGPASAEHQMGVKPDFGYDGETAYKGSGKLKDKVRL